MFSGFLFLWDLPVCECVCLSIYICFLNSSLTLFLLFCPILVPLFWFYIILFYYNFRCIFIYYWERKRKNRYWFGCVESNEYLKRVEGRETIDRIYCIKTFIFNKNKNKNKYFILKIAIKMHSPLCHLEKWTSNPVRIWLIVLENTYHLYNKKGDN